MNLPAALVPFGISVLLLAWGARLGTTLPPAAAVRLLTGLALVTSLATGFVLCAAAVLGAAQLPAVAALGHWSAPVLRAHADLPTALGVLAGLLAGGLLVAAVIRLVRAGRQLHAAADAGRRLGSGELVVLDDEVPCAYAIAGLRGKVVVSTAMLRALRPDERRVLLAHEQAHLVHRHHMYVQLAELAAVASPMLRGLVPAIRLATERWADEVAAVEVGDRTLVARGLARAALVRHRALAAGQFGPRVGLAAADHGVAERVRGLLAPAPRRRPVMASTMLTAILACSLAAVITGWLAHRQIETAEVAYVAARVR